MTEEQIKKRAESKKRNHQKKTLGTRSGRLTVIGFTDDEDYKYICRCDCGNECIVSHQCFKKGGTKSCGCLQKELVSNRCKRKIVIGKTYGKLTVLGEARSPSGRLRWRVKCEECGRELNATGRTIEYGCGKCPSCRQKGRNNPAWDETLTEEQRLKRRNWECKEDIEKWRKDVFERENYTCEKCGKKGGILNAHHKDGYHWNEERRADVSNGACLCEHCHKKFHSKYGLKYNTEEQYIAFLIEDFDNEENEN